MNLFNVSWQESKTVFLWVAVLSAVGMVALPASVLIYMRRRKLNFVPDTAPL